MSPVAATSPDLLAEQGRSTRPTGDASHVDTLTGYRGLAALVVLVVHGAGHTAYPHIGLHGYGPLALFVLSGYLLVTPWSRWSLGTGGAPNLRTFARRRVARIFPAYLIVLVVVALIYPASQPKDAASWVRALTLTNFLGSDGLRPAMEHTWSMGTEFSWYVSLPLVGLVLAVLGRRVWPLSRNLPMYAVVAASVVITAAWLVWVDTSVQTLTGQLTYPLWLPGYLACFVLGAAVRHLELSAGMQDGGRTWLTTVRKHWWAPTVVAVAAVGVLVSELSGPEGYVTLTFAERTTRTASATVLAVAVLVIAVTGAGRRAVNLLLGGRAMVAVGRWSYGIYLWHLPVTMILVANMDVPAGPFGFGVWIALILGVSAALGAATYTFVEVPSIAWSRRDGSSR